MEETIDSFSALMDHYYKHHNWLDVVLLFWNFLASMVVVLLAIWRIQDIESQRLKFHNYREFILCKISLVLIAMGSVFHAIQFEPPSLRESLIYSGVLLYLLLRRIKQKRDGK